MLKNNKMLYGLLVLFVGLAMSFSTATAQVTGEQDTETDTETQSSFTGKVVDAENGQALSDVTVEIEGQDQEATTDEEGQFNFDNLDTQGQEGQGMGVRGDDITIRINHDGYEELTETISANELGQGAQGQTGETGETGQTGMGADDEDVRTFELQPEDGAQGQDQDQGGGMPPLK